MGGQEDSYIYGLFKPRWDGFPEKTWGHILEITDTASQLPVFQSPCILATLIFFRKYAVRITKHMIQQKTQRGLAGEAYAVFGTVSRLISSCRGIVCSQEQLHLLGQKLPCHKVFGTLLSSALYHACGIRLGLVIMPVTP